MSRNIEIMPKQNAENTAATPPDHLLFHLALLFLALIIDAFATGRAG